MRISTQLIVICIVLVLSSSSIAEVELEGVKVPDSKVVDEVNLSLNGVGLRLATMLKVKVYVMALYLQSPGNDAETIINSTEAARIELHMLRNVDGDDMRDAWEEGFEKNYKGSADLSAELKSLQSATGDLKDGDLMAFDFAGSKVIVSINGEAKGTIEGAEFRKALTSVWLGKKPPNKEVKEGVLGLAD